MNTVIIVNLNGRAYKLEEAGAEALRAYLDQAHARLADNPDKDEILKDFEQAIAEKFDAHITQHKNVVTAETVTRSIEEMGPVQSDRAGTDAGAAEPSGGPKREPAGKRLYRIREGEKLWGVCTGLAAYFDIDVTIVRVAFVVLALISHGAGVGLYILMAIVVPVAETAADRASARGEEFNAHELIESLRKKYAKYAEESYWHDAASSHADRKQARRKTMRERHREHQERFRGAASSVARVAASVFAIIGSVALGILSVGYVATLWSLLATGMLFGHVLALGLSPILLIVAASASFYIPGWPLFLLTQEARRLASRVREERDLWDVMAGAVAWGISIALVAIIAVLSVPQFDHAQVPYGFHFYLRHREVCVGGNDYCQNLGAQ